METGPVSLTAGDVNGRGSGGWGNTIRATAARPHRARAVVAVLATGLLLTACSSSGTSSPSSPSASPATTSAAAAAPSPTSAVCQAAANLRTSVNALTHVKIGKGTVNEIKSDLANVKADFTALTAQLHGKFSAQTSA